MSASKPVTWAVAGIAAIVLAFGAYTIGSNTSGAGSSGTAAAAQPGASGPLPRSGQMPQSGQTPPGFGTAATGAAAKKAAAAALARYSGNVEQVMALQDGSYVVHVITAKGEYHVAVSRDFEVTGADQGGTPPQGAAPPSGTGSSSGSTS